MSEGTLTRAGRMQVDGEFLTGVFVEMSGHEIMRLSRKDMYNKPVAVILDRRKTPRVEIDDTLERVTVDVTKSDGRWSWKRTGTDKITGKSNQSFGTPSEALYDAYQWEVRGDEDKEQV
jgi:hypothetical protein